jgi:hypothetical protein
MPRVSKLYQTVWSGLVWVCTVWVCNRLNPGPELYGLEIT